MTIPDTLVIGRDVGKLVLKVIPGQGWWAHTKPAAFPDGTQIQFRFAGGQPWTATYTGGVASFSQTADDVAALREGQAVTLWFIQAGTPDLLTHRGRVSVQ